MDQSGWNLELQYCSYLYLFAEIYRVRSYFEECVLNGQFPIGNWACCAQMDVNHPQISAKIPHAAASFKGTQE
jgi:hypothetical protein